MQTKLDNGQLRFALNGTERKYNLRSLPVLAAIAAATHDTEAAAAVELLRSRLDANGDWKGKADDAE